MRAPIRYVRHLAVAVAAGAALSVAASAPGCRAATQVTVELRTSGFTCAELKGVAIVVAGNPRAAEDRMIAETYSTQIAKAECGPDPHSLGTLVVTPSGNTGSVVVRARVSDAPEATCKSPDYRGCIVARRAFSFVDHAGVTLPITLELSCADVPCDVVTSCRTGTCVPSRAECTEDVPECSSEAEPVTAPDGGVILPDGAVADGSTLVDGAHSDGATEAASDAPSDAVVDAPPDGGNRTNRCPATTDGGDPDCFVSGATPICCGASTGWFCAANGGCSPPNPALSCMGAAHCPANMWCCGNPMGAQPSSNCAAVCMNEFVCSVNADCPPPMTCKPTGPTIGGRILQLCSN